MNQPLVNQHGYECGYRIYGQIYIYKYKYTNKWLFHNHMPLSNRKIYFSEIFRLIKKGDTKSVKTGTDHLVIK